MSRGDSVGVGHDAAAIHITHQKAGSQWVLQILMTLAPGHTVAPRSTGGHVTDAPLQPGKIYPNVYLPPSRLDQVSPGIARRYAVILRDLRDVWLSLYASLRFSHMPTPRNHADRALLARLDRRDGLRFTMRSLLPPLARIQTGCVERGLRVHRYEELVADPPRAFRAFFDDLGLEVGDQVLRSTLERFSFEKQTGRQRGDVDESSHLRRGEPGEWRTVDGDLLGEFHALYGLVLQATGYEPMVRSVRAAPPRPACWCGGSGRSGRCATCGTVIGPGKLSLAEVWSDLASRWGDPAHTATANRVFIRGGDLDHRLQVDLTAPRSLRYIAELASRLGRRSRVLEILPAPGATATVLQRAGHDVHGIEVSANVAATVATRSGAKVGAGSEFDVGSGWDAVILNEALSLIPHPLHLASALRASLAPKGFLSVREVGPNERLPTETHDRSSLEAPAITAPRRWVFGRRALERLLREAGFPHISAAGDDHLIAAVEPPPAPSGSCDDPLVTALLSRATTEQVHAQERRSERMASFDDARRAVEHLGEGIVFRQTTFADGWHDMERGDTWFRWGESGAAVKIAPVAVGDYELHLDIEPGPGVGSKAFTLLVRDERGVTLTAIGVSDGRTSASALVNLRGAPSSTLRFDVAGARGQPTPGDPRTLDFRVFGIGLDPVPTVEPRRGMMSS